MTTYQSLDDIYRELDAVRERLVARVARLTPEQAAFRPDPSSWTPTEVVEHLSIAEAGVCQVLANMVGQAEAEGPAADSGFRPFSLAELAEKAAGKKFQAPERIAPTGQVPLAESLARLSASRASLHALRPRLAAVDLSEIRYPHIAFGPINGYQWLAFIGAHEMRHGAQIKNILAAAPAAKTAESRSA